MILYKNRHKIYHIFKAIVSFWIYEKIRLINRGLCRAESTNNQKSTKVPKKDHQKGKKYDGFDNFFENTSFILQPNNVFSI